MIKITETVKHLMIINVIMFVATLVIGENQFGNLFALHFPTSNVFKPWQIITHMFMHGGFTHLLFNMFALWMFGSAVEQRLGSKKFLIIYFAAGLGAVLFQLGYYYFDYYSLMSDISNLGLSENLIDQIVNFDIRDGNSYTGAQLQKQLLPLLAEHNISQSLLTETNFSALFNMNVITNTGMLGASGCIMGILAAFGVMNPEAELMLIFLPIPIKAKYFIPGIILLDVISALTGQSFFSPSNTAYMAHVGGAVIGFLIMWYWKKNSFNKYRIY
ncbi:rhomboid family intramembrane serine protease [Lacinutrix chionoecetis]